MRVTADQMHQLDIVKVEICSFRLFKPAIGQIAFNEDASTVVLIAVLRPRHPADRQDRRRGETRRSAVRDRQPRSGAGADRPDRRRAGAGQEPSRQLALAKRVLDRQTGLLRRQGDLAARSSIRRAPTTPSRRDRTCSTAEGTLDARRATGCACSSAAPRRKSRASSASALINPLITINAPIDGTVIARKVGPGQYVRSDSGDAALFDRRPVDHVAEGQRAGERHPARPRRPGDRGQGHRAARPRVQGAQ